VGVPRLTYTVSAGWTPGVLWPLMLRVTTQGLSSYPADDANSVTVPAYGLTSLTLGLADPVALTAALVLSGFITVNNVFNRVHIASAFLNPDVVGGAPLAFEPGLPRTLLISFSLTAPTGH